LDCLGIGYYNLFKLIAKEWFKDEYILSIKEIAPSMASQIDSKERVWDI
jgi:hypothetical protein